MEKRKGNNMRKFEYREKDGFQEAIVNQIPNLLDDAIDWISKKLEPEDVFSIGDLEAWAETNGYEKKEE
jgi:hypothetical protein